MSRHVVLITDAHEAPAYELIEALRAAGLKTLIEGLREVEIEVELARQRESTGPAESLGPPPLAVLYEVVPGADMVELHTAVEHAKAFWPGAPLIACRRHVNGNVLAFAPLRIKLRSCPRFCERSKDMG